MYFHNSILIIAEDTDDPDSLTFLYTLVRGPAERSYGLNVARLAGLSQAIIKTAATKSKELESMVNERKYVSNKYVAIHIGKINQD